MQHRIDTVGGRNKLKPRREPYWQKLQAGSYLGYRRTQSGGSWVVRARVGDKQRYEAIGPLPETTPAEQFDEAQKQAREWLKGLGSSHNAAYTVKDAIDDYVEHRRLHNSASSAKDAEQRLYKHAVPALGDIRLSKLTMQRVKKWRDSLVRTSESDEDTRKSKDGANKLLAMLKTALNLAYRNDIIGTDRAWRRVEAFRDVGAARKVFLTEKQVKALCDNTAGAFRDLVLSGVLTGARYGELVAATVADLDLKHGTLHLSGKTGGRDCYLSDDALAHFKRLAEDKLPTALLHIREDGAAWGKSHQHRPMRAAVKKAKLPPETCFYSLRHTYISRALLAGVNIQMVAENCGTSVRMIEKHYGKFLKADRRAMFNKVRLS